MRRRVDASDGYLRSVPPVVVVLAVISVFRIAEKVDDGIVVTVSRSQEQDLRISERLDDALRVDVMAYA